MSSDSSDVYTQRVDLERYVHRRVGDSVLSEDIVQEAYLRLLVYQAKPGNAVANVNAFLRRISLNLVRDHFRRAHRQPVIELTEDIPCERSDIHRQLEHRQLVGIVAAVLKGMPRLRREVFVRRRVHGQSTKEVGADLGLSQGAVNTHVARAVLDLHRAIEKMEKRGGPVRE